MEQTAAAITATIFAGSYILLRSVSNNILTDIQAFRKLVPASLTLKKQSQVFPWSFVDQWLQTVSQNGEKVFLKFIRDDETTVSYTFNQVDEISNQVANVLVTGGSKPGDVIALMMDNRPEYIITWLGIIKLGCVAALINTNLTGKPLIHSLVTSKAKKFIIGAEHLDVVSATRSQLQEDKNEENADIKNGLFYVVGREAEGFVSMDKFVREQAKKLLPGLYPKRKPSDSALYIYTSGTTGLPKASIITSARLWGGGLGFYRLFSLEPNDIYYCCLPFYHSAATIIATSLCIYGGLTLVFRRKFSATHYWKDCINHNATAAQYIGELCHYLNERPPSPDDKRHKVRLMIGNGLRPSLWPKFQERFGIKQIGEFYAATEGTASLFNITGKQGAVGYMPQILLKTIVPLALIKYDIDTDEVVRGKDGFCIRCATNEPGQLISPLEQDGSLDFKGYTSKAATEKKILRNVFKTGDAYFMSGDLLKIDPDGYFYFVDRIGDTYRWKGENVATGEVEGVIKEFPGVREVNVYGVTMPNTSGRAGMAYIVIDDSFDMKKFYNYTQEKLPSYALPLFLRIAKEIEVTGTLKHLKATKRNEGFDPKIVKEPIYYRDTKDAKNYIPLTEAIFNHIMGENQNSKL